MKKLRMVCLLAVAGTALLGCSRQPAGQEQTETAREELVLWSYYETDAQRSGLNSLIGGFNQSQNQYHVTWEYVPMTDFDKELSRSYTEQELPDMVLIDNPDMPSFMRMGIFEDITDRIEDWDLAGEYYPAALETVRLDGRYYGIPFICNNLGLIYNTKMLDEAGIDPPKNWEELQSAALALTTEDRSGFLMCAISSEQGAFQIIPWILGAGEPIDQIGGKLTEQTYSFLNSLVEEGSMSSDCINLSQTDVARKFIAGDTAMMENGPWILSMLDKAGVPYGIAKFPTGAQEAMVTGGENIGIVKGKNVDGSLAFLQYCQGENVMESFCKNTGALPARRENTRKLTKSQPKLQVFADQMEYAISRTSIPEWNTLSESLTSNFYSMISGEITPKRAANAIRIK